MDHLYYHLLLRRVSTLFLPHRNSSRRTRRKMTSKIIYMICFSVSITLSRVLIHSLIVPFHSLTILFRAIGEVNVQLNLHSNLPSFNGSKIITVCHSKFSVALISE